MFNLHEDILASSTKSNQPNLRRHYLKMCPLNVKGNTAKKIEDYTFSLSGFPCLIFTLHCIIIFYNLPVDMLCKRICVRMTYIFFLFDFLLQHIISIFSQSCLFILGSNYNFFFILIFMLRFFFYFLRKRNDIIILFNPHILIYFLGPV